MPGVARAGVGWPMPFSGSRWSSTYRAPGTALDGQEPLADYGVVTPAYFATLEIPFVDGRTFEISDPRHAVIVSRRIAEAAWPEGGWLGRELVMNPWGGADTADRLASNRTAMGLVGLFWVVAGGLALVGLYGVIAYAVRLRTRELGIRMALGAARAQAVRLVLGHGMRLTLVGLALGLGGSVVLSGFLRGWLFGVEPTDPATYGLVALGLGALSLAAAWLPARRVARLDPAETLRSE